MIDRRHFMCGCTAFALFGSSQNAHGNENNRFDYPCGITEQKFLSLSKNSQLSSAIPLEERYNFSLVNSLGNKDFEDIFSEALVDIANTFSIYPDFRYYKDFEEPSALATPYRLKHNLNKSDGTVLLGIQFFRNAMKNKGGDVGILAVCAHEFAHIVGFKRELRKKLYNAGMKKFAFELHADFLTGYFLHIYKKQYPALNIDGVVPVWEKFGSKDFSDPGSHGTYKMRRKAISEGFFLVEKNSTLTFDDAYNAATQHVSQYRV